MEREPAKCPACLATSCVEIRNFTVSQSAQHFILREENPELHQKLKMHVRALWDGDHCAIKLCRTCGFGFAWPYVAGDEQFYQLAFPHIGYTTNRWEFERTILELSHFDTHGMRALEIGAGFGMFLDQLVRTGLPARDICAIEYHPVARARLSEKGYRAISIDVRSSDFVPQDRFDLVFMFQVAEHMDCLDELMDKLARICTDRAHIFVSVPNAERTNYVEEHGWQFDMPPAHVGRWTLRAMAHLAGRHEFRVESSEQQPLGWIKFLGEDLVSHYYQKARTPGTRAHRVRVLPRSPLRRYLEMCTVLSYAPRRVPEWIRAFRYGGQLGGALFLHLVKEAGSDGRPTINRADRVSNHPVKSDARLISKGP